MNLFDYFCIISCAPLIWCWERRNDGNYLVLMSYVVLPQESAE